MIIIIYALKDDLWTRELWKEEALYVAKKALLCFNPAGRAAGFKDGNIFVLLETSRAALFFSVIRY